MTSVLKSKANLILYPILTKTLLVLFILEIFNLEMTRISELMGIKLSWMVGLPCL